MSVYNLELVRKNEIKKLVVTHKQFTVDMLFSLIFFFITLIFVYLQKLQPCLIIYSYKPNPSFLPWPWNFSQIMITMIGIELVQDKFFLSFHLLIVHGCLNTLLWIIVELIDFRQYNYVCKLINVFAGAILCTT